MSNAFKCDACGDLEEGEPERYKLRYYASVALTGWSDSQTLESAELCEGCSTKLEGAVFDVLSPSDEGGEPLGEVTEYPYRGYCAECGARHEVGSDLPDTGCQCGGDIVPQSAFVGPLAELMVSARRWADADMAAQVELLAKDAGFPDETVHEAVDVANAWREQDEFDREVAGDD